MHEYNLSGYYSFSFAYYYFVVTHCICQDLIYLKLFYPDTVQNQALLYFPSFSIPEVIV